MAIADLDGDGIVDLAVAFGGNSPLGGGPIGGLALLKGLSGGEFAEPQYFNAGVQPVSIDAGDLNGDDAPDLILANQLSNNVAVFFNNGDGVFQAPVFYPVGSWPQRIALADMDQDGDIDAIVMNRFSNDLSVLYNNGGGTFISTMTVSTPNTVNTSLSIVDTTGDSFPEVLVPTSGQETISLHRNLNGHLDPKPIVIEVGFSVPVADLAPLDNDCELDITAGGREDAPDPTLEPALQQNFLGEGMNEFVPVDLVFFGVLGHAPSAQCVSDLDKDGDIDIAAAFGNEVSVLLNKTNAPNIVDLTGDGFVNTPDLVILLNTWGKPGAADFDKSGAVDGRDLAHLLSNWTAPAQRAPVIAAEIAPSDWKFIRSTRLDINQDRIADRLELRTIEGGASGRSRAKFDVFLSGEGGELRHVSTLDSSAMRMPAEWRLFNADADPHLDLIVFDPEAQCLFIFLGSETYGFDSELVTISTLSVRSLNDAVAELNALQSDLITLQRQNSKDSLSDRMENH